MLLKLLFVSSIQFMINIKSSSKNITVNYSIVCIVVLGEAITRTVMITKPTLKYLSIHTWITIIISKNQWLKHIVGVTIINTGVM